jgi:formylglycine-generating enzyme required for sulfatase activity
MKRSLTQRSGRVVGSRRRIPFLLLVLGLVCGLATFVMGLPREASAADVANPTATPMLGDQCINPTDGAVLVYVPAGPFIMGSPDGVGATNEHPRHTVTLDGYWIYRDAVTVNQYRKFCEATKRTMPTEPSYKWQGDNPMTGVTWDDAVAYGAWAKVTLPTEAQWEKAARGETGRNYPWGGEATPEAPTDGWDETKCACLANSRQADNTWSGPHPVGSFPEGNAACGARDLVGNVKQWLADRYDASYYATAPAANPVGPEQTTFTARCVRGGNYWSDNSVTYRCAARYSYDPRFSAEYLGFRGVSLTGVFSASPIVSDTLTGFLQNGTTLVPLRGIAEWFGAKVTFDATVNGIHVQMPNTNIILFLGNTQANVNGTPVELATPALERDGATYVPVRFLAEALNARVGWDDATSTVTITNPASGKVLALRVTD